MGTSKKAREALASRAFRNQPDLHYRVFRMAVKAAFEVPLVQAD